jgi:UDP-N-acetyl-2-amino-2-deoxyglucuronate dehydrogenase
MPNSIKVGVITNAQGAHLPDYFASLARTEEVDAVVLADPSGQTVAAARKGLGDKLKDTYKDAAEMLRQAKPQLALVSLEAALAPPLIDLALEASCHVFVEKPACVRAEDFEPLVQKAQRKHRHLIMAFANRLHAPVQEARRLLADGKLGRIWGIEVHFIADQTRLTRKEARDQWFYSKARAGGGCLTWLGIHWLDLALYITGRKVKQVAGFAGVVGGQPLDVEDSAALSLCLDNDTFGTMTCGYFLDKGYQTHLQVWGQHGWLRLAAVEEEPLQWYSTKEGKDAGVQRFEYPKGGRGYFPFVRAAVRASAGLETAPITGEESLHVLKTIFAFYQAARTGRAQSV